MAIAVMIIIILLNVGLLLVVMRIGTQGEHHSEFKPEQSTAVMTLQNRLNIAKPAPAIASKTEETVTSADDSDGE